MASRYLRFQSGGPSQPNRSPAFERVLARADEVRASPEWRVDAFSILSPGTPLPAVAAVVQRAAVARGAADASSRATWLCAATPVHYLAEIANVRLAYDGILSLEAAEAGSLAADFNRLWSGSGVRLTAAARQLICGFDAPVQAGLHEPDAARGRRIETFLPSGEDAARLRMLMSEMEMWLFDHDVNKLRLQHLRPSISALWLWGGGAPLDTLPAIRGGAAGEDVFFGAFPAADPTAADVMVSEAVPGTPAWSELESGWLDAALADLARGRLARLELSADGRRYALTAGWRRRVWRRTKAWWEFFP